MAGLISIQLVSLELGSMPIAMGWANLYTTDIVEEVLLVNVKRWKIRESVLSMDLCLISLLVIIMRHCY